MALNQNKKSNSVAPMSTNKLWSEKEPKTGSAKKHSPLLGPLILAAQDAGENSINFNLYKKYQEKAKLPFYTTYSKSEWSQIQYVTIGIATSNRIRQWAEKTLPNGKVVGEVTNANTLHHKTFKPIKGGLFCERIFGPLKDFECACSNNLGKQIKKLKKTQKKTQNLAESTKADNTAALFAQETLQKLLQKKVAMRGNNMGTSVVNERFFCPQCDVEYTWSVMRRYQLGYINLNAPVAHVWYLKSSPNYLSALLDMKRKHLEYITYCTETLTLENSLKSSAEVLTNVADSFDFIQRSRNPNVVKAEPYPIDNSFVAPRTEHNRAIGKGLPLKKKKNTYYFRKKCLSLYSNLKGSTGASLPQLEKNASTESFTLFSNTSKESLGKGKKKHWLTTNVITGLLQKYDKKVLSAKALTDLYGFAATEMFENTTSEEPVDLPLFYSLRQLARCGVVLTFLQSTQNLKTAASGGVKKSFFTPRLKESGNKASSIITNSKVAKLTGPLVVGAPQPLLHISNLAKLETFCRFKLLAKTNQAGREMPLVNLKENLRQAYVMKLEASLSLQSKAKGLQTASGVRNINWKQTLTLARFCNNSLNPYQVAPQNLTINNLTKMVDILWLLMAANQTTNKTQGELQKALPNKLIKPNQGPLKGRGLVPCFAVKSSLPKELLEQVYANTISRILFIKQLLTSRFFDNCSPPEAAQKSNMDTVKLDLQDLEPTKVLAPLLSRSVECSAVRKNIKTVQNDSNSTLVFSSSFIKKSTWPLIRFALALSNKARSPGPKKPYGNSKTATNSSLFASQSGGAKVSAKPLLQGSCLILKKSRLRRSLAIKKTKASLGMSLTKRFIQLQQSYKFNSKKTIVNNLYCFSHRLLWNHAVDWQFFSLYYFSFKAVNSKTKQYNNLVGNNTTGARVKNMANLEDVNIPVYAYRNYDFSLLNTFFSQDLTAKSKYGVPTKYNFTQELGDKQNLHINYSGAGILKTLLADLDSTEIRKIYKQNVMTLFGLNKRIVKTRHLLLISSQAGDMKGITGTKSSRRSYQKQLNEMCQNRELIMGKIKLLRKLFSTERSTGLAQQQATSKTKKQYRSAGQNVVTQANPKDMVLTILPVLPPDLRPIVKMGTQIAASDLNRFYQRILYRNDRLKRFLKDAAINGSYEMKYAQRLLQEAVDNLIQNGKSGVTPEKDARGRLLKSLSDILKGKQGRFRQYLLGKRVDYSGRSVIVVGPSLKLHECGIPKEMALELFLPFLIKRILTDNLARTVIGAKTLIQKNKPLTWALLREILKSSPVLLNRAPTLHRLGFQAFQPKLVDGRAILLHPLVCPAFNADFDGDQMAVHVPISPEARAEAWKLMLSRNNLLSPATGEPLVLPSQDMVLGCYYLTTNCNVGFEGKIQKSEKGYGLYFNSLNDVLRAYQQGLLSIHAIIWLKWNGKVENSVRTGNGNFKEHEPAEIRLNQYGGSYVIYARSYSTYNYSQNSGGANNDALTATKTQSYKAKNKLVNNIIRTTPGKILFNVIVGMALNNTTLGK